MPIERIGSIAVVVSDVNKSKEWYRDKLEFEVQDDMEHWVVVRPPGSSTGIHLCQVEPLEPGNTGQLLVWCKPPLKSTISMLNLIGTPNGFLSDRSIPILPFLNP